MRQRSSLSRLRDGATRTLLVLALPIFLGACNADKDEKQATNAKIVEKTAGLVAFWDFKPDEDGRLLSVSGNKRHKAGYEFFLHRIGDPSGYRIADWPYADDQRSTIAIDASGPFAHALRMDTGHIYAASPRNAFEGSELDLSGRKAFTMIAWVKFVGTRHMIAGIWDEGGWEKYAGKRQAALFAGLFNQKGVIAHISATGAASFPQSNITGAQYARRRAIDGQPFENDRWVTVAMTFDPEKEEVIAWLDGRMTEYAIPDPVEQDVYGFEKTPPSNPYKFDQSVFHPSTPLLKFNGYDRQSTGIAEHRLQLDLKKGLATYDRDVIAETDSAFRLEISVQSEGGEVSKPVLVDAVPGKPFSIPVVNVEEKITARLLEVEGNDWEPVGTPVSYVYREGAPFTVGRALGLGEGLENIEEGSRMYIDGLAVFNRVLSAEELKMLTF